MNLLARQTLAKATLITGNARPGFFAIETSCRCRRPCAQFPPHLPWMVGPVGSRGGNECCPVQRTAATHKPSACLLGARVPQTQLAVQGSPLAQLWSEDGGGGTLTAQGLEPQSVSPPTLPLPPVPAAHRDPEPCGEGPRCLKNTSSLVGPLKFGSVSAIGLF